MLKPSATDISLAQWTGLLSDPTNIVWHPQGERGHADPDGPPSKSRVSGSTETLYTLPMASITVLRGSIGDQ